MYSIKGARYVLVDHPPQSCYQTKWRIGMVVGDMVHLWRGQNQWHHVGNKIAKMKVVRDATPRERLLGCRLETP